MNWQDIKEALGFDRFARFTETPKVKVEDLREFRDQSWRGLVKVLPGYPEDAMTDGERQKGYEYAFVWGASEIITQFERLGSTLVEHGSFLPLPLVHDALGFSQMNWQEKMPSKFNGRVCESLLIIDAWLCAQLGDWEMALETIRSKPTPVVFNQPHTMAMRMWEDYLIQDRRPEVRLGLRRFLDQRAPIPGDRAVWLVAINERYGYVVAAHAAIEVGELLVATEFAKQTAREAGVYRVREVLLGMKSVGIAIDEATGLLVFDRLMHHRLYNDAALLANAFRMTDKVTEVIKEWHDWAVATGNTKMVLDFKGERAIPRGDGATIRCAPDPRYKDEGKTITA
ncbi:MAG: hypothetical protein NUV56_01905 [Candidatus Uhrbacteria bacterium]|nr:hypothetical protein [Candidatus Uhrbacteria bacterium]